MQTYKNIFEILREAEDEPSETAQNDTGGGDEAPSSEESDASADDDYGEDGDFDINTDLNDEDSGDGDDSGSDGGDDMDMGGDDSSSDSGDSSSTATDTSEEEPVEANTDIFSSLSAEEQQIKIKELKKQFSDLYTSTDDLLAKINETETDEDNLLYMNRINMTIYYLKQYISDYMTYSFAFKSYIENDITFNRFLTILNSISAIINDIAKDKDGKNH